MKGDLEAVVAGENDGAVFLWKTQDEVLRAALLGMDAIEFTQDAGIPPGVAKPVLPMWNDKGAIIVGCIKDKSGPSGGQEAKRLHQNIQMISARRARPLRRMDDLSGIDKKSDVWPVIDGFKKQLLLTQSLRVP